MKIVLGQTKGGVGKTTTAINLAIELSRKGRDVLLIDADEQATSTDFTTVRTQALGSPGYTAIQLSDGAVRAQILQLSTKFTDIIVDAGGRDTGSLRAALTICDLVLIPFQPRSFDLWTLDKVTKLVSEARNINPDLKAAAFINFADPSGNDNVESGEFIKQNDVVSLLKTQVGRRKAFANAATCGLSVCEMKSSDPKACSEITALLNEIYENEFYVADELIQSATKELEVTEEI